MTFERQDVTEDFYAGNSKDLTITIYLDEAKTTVKDLTGAEITWALFTDDHNVLLVKNSVDSSEIEVPTPANGICIVHIDPADTLDLYGTYKQHVNVVDGNGKESTVLTGKVRIFRSFARRPSDDSQAAYLEGG